jgi:hypothetical protein
MGRERCIDQYFGLATQLSDMIGWANRGRSWSDGFDWSGRCRGILWIIADRMLIVDIIVPYKIRGGCRHVKCGCPAQGLKKKKETCPVQVLKKKKNVSSPKESIVRKS